MLNCASAADAVAGNGREARPPLAWGGEKTSVQVLTAKA
jgi:hypothetical protein